MVLAACGTEPEPVDKPEVTVGVLADFSAEDPSLALRVLRGVDLALDHYNAEDASKFQAKVGTFDTQGNPEGAVAAANAAAEDSLVIGVIGPLAPDEILAAGDVLEEARLPFLIPNVADTSIPKEGWRGFRRLVSSLEGEGQALGDAAATQGDRGPTSLISVDQGRPRTLMESARDFLEDAGVEIAHAEIVDGIEGQAAKVKDSAAVVFLGPAALGGTFVKTLREAGFQGAFLASSEARQDAFSENAGEHAEGSLTECVCASVEDPDLAGFASDFKAKFNVDAGEFAAESYEGALMLLEGAEEVGTRQGRIVAFFASARGFRGETKVYRFNTKGEIGVAVVTLWSFDEGEWRFSGRLELQAGA